MITTTDIANIIYKDCKAFGIEVYQNGNIPVGDITKERIVIHSKAQTPGKIWKKSFVDINFCVPNIMGNADLIRLNQLERLGYTMGKVGSYDGTTYSYSVASSSIENEESFNYHFVNIKLLFEILNVK